MTEAIFSYGTLQLESVQLASFGRRLAGEDDVLHGFAVIEIQIQDPAVLDASGIETHLALVPGDGPPIAGKVFQLTAQELAAADIYESENYRRLEAPLASGKTAWVYVKA
jgi:gamma-glutamylcyclotransferase (GGCT)/AIG2-like uncharacterized protein YtfP